MRHVLGGLALISALTAGTAASAFDISGNYLITAMGHGGVNGATLCATVVQNGALPGFPTSGTVTIQGFSGYWFRAGSKGATFEIPLPNGFITFSGVFGAPQIAGTSFIEVANGEPVAAGYFTAQKGGC